MQIPIKKPHEIEAIRRSGALAAQITGELVALSRPGVTTRELNDVAQARITAAKAKSAFFEYESFPAVLCCSLNNIAVHGPPSNEELQEGDILGLYFGVVLDEWYSDMAVTVPIGKVSADAIRLLQTTREALDIGIAQARHGKRLEDISASIQEHVEKAGFEIIRELAGHGIGKKLHEPPQVPNYGKWGNGPVLENGMVLAIEPIIALSAKHVRLSKDGLSYETEDGSLAAHFEHTVAITKQGPEILTLP